MVDIVQQNWEQVVDILKISDKVQRKAQEISKILWVQWEEFNITLVILMLDFFEMKQEIEEISEEDKKLFYDKLNEYYKKELEEIEANKFRDKINFKDIIDVKQFEKSDDWLWLVFQQLSNMNSRKNNWVYFTPREIWRLCSKIAMIWKNKEDIESVYDPTNWTSWLLLEFWKLFWTDKTKYYWQEISKASTNIWELNLFLNLTKFENIWIVQGDTLYDPKQTDKKFDVVISNPPYSLPYNKDDEKLKNDPRFEGRTYSPNKAADWMFVRHSLYHLKDNWIWCFVVFPWILYRTWNEQKIRKEILEMWIIESVIILPDNLFYWTWISPAVVILKKDKKDDKIAFIDATKWCVKKAKNNLLLNETIDDIVKVIETKEEINNERIRSKICTPDNIVANDYDLSVNKYAEKEDTSEKIDIKEVNRQLFEWRFRIDQLRDEVDNIVAMIENWTYWTKDEEEEAKKLEKSKWYEYFKLVMLKLSQSLPEDKKELYKQLKLSERKELFSIFDESFWNNEQTKEENN